ncbi:hypothetical protein T02_4885 [Trichinella nativa]|uniref:PiggyBac transposable element-derived protein domain-containing protein n=1 Tax=Trichinella nativa TaxID=6335 RepID=A0A0V1LWD7_9BILA|nr:hypothetical protein T02_4885 [Trichinella nativa]
MANLIGRSCSRETWKPLDVTDLRVYVGLLILGGVCRFRREATGSLWNAENGRAIFPAVMLLKKFHLISRMIDKIRPSQFQGVTSLKRQVGNSESHMRYMG